MVIFLTYLLNIISGIIFLYLLQDIAKYFYKSYKEKKKKSEEDAFSLAFSKEKTDKMKMSIVENLLFQENNILNAGYSNEELNTICDAIIENIPMMLKEVDSIYKKDFLVMAHSIPRELVKKEADRKIIFKKIYKNLYGKLNYMGLNPKRFTEDSIEIKMSSLKEFSKYEKVKMLK